MEASKRQERSIMKVRIELDPSMDEPEILIRAPRLTQELAQLQESILKQKLVPLAFYKDRSEYFLDLANILFFEIGSNVLNKYLPSARCCSPIRNIRFLLSLLFSLMVYPPNSSTIPTIGMGIVSELHIFCKVFFAFI